MRGCIEHTQQGNKGGYGTAKHNGKTEYLHRVAYCEHNGVTIESIKGLVVMHTCDNTRCRNPLHLQLGTHQDNSDDMVAKGRHVSLLGEDHQTSILTQEQVTMIRQVYKPRCRTFGARSLARQLGVGEATVRDVLKGRTWA